jgi:predicted phosphodiesterase
MKIIATSDLHYGYSEKTYEILDNFYNKINEKNPDYIIIAGDIISHNQDQWDPALEQLREYFGVPILVVLGNHDFWNSPKKSIWETKKYIFEKFEQHDITYLPTNPIEEDTFNIYGFDGWYNKNPPSNDLNFMYEKTEGINTHEYMKYEAEQQLKNIPGKKYIKNHIVVTHFEMNNSPMAGDKRWLEELEPKTDTLIVGHSHKINETFFRTMKIINPGSDYDDPIFYQV